MTKPANPETQTLTISARQYDLIAQAEAAVKKASENRNLVIQAVVAGHDIPDGASYQGAQKDPPAIVVRLPEAKE